MIRSWLLVLLAACDASADGSRTDARVIPDAESQSDDSLQDPYRHAIALDGLDDFATGEQFATTSTSFAARVTWDDKYLYIGYSGPDLSKTVGDANTKWLFSYVDTGAGGAAQSELYNTQRAMFPIGFAADYYVRYKVDGTLASLKRSNGAAWTDASPPPATAQADTFVELAIPFTAIGVTVDAGAQLGIVTYMINEKANVEGTYAGLYTNNFTDGYSANMPLTAYLQADLSSSRAPNDPANRKP